MSGDHVCSMVGFARPVGGVGHVRIFLSSAYLKPWQPFPICRWMPFRAGKATTFPSFAGDYGRYTEWSEWTCDCSMWRPPSSRLAKPPAIPRCPPWLLRSSFDNSDSWESDLSLVLVMHVAIHILPLRPQLFCGCHFCDAPPLRSQDKDACVQTEDEGMQQPASTIPPQELQHVWPGPVRGDGCTV